MSELTIQQASAKYNVCPSTIYNWITSGMIPSEKRLAGKNQTKKHVFEDRFLESILASKNRYRNRLHRILRDKPKSVEQPELKIEEAEQPKSEFGKQLLNKIEQMDQKLLSITGKQIELANTLKLISSKVASDVTLNAGLNGLESKITEWAETSDDQLHGTLAYEKRISEMEGREAVLDRLIKDLMQKK